MKQKKYGSSIIFFILFFAVLGVLVVSYYKYIVKEDFLIYAQVSCDPATESCFVWQCSPDDDESCSSDPEEQIWHYKVIYKNAIDTPRCDPLSESGCPELTCEVDDASCETVYCTQDNSLLYQENEYCS